MNIQQRPSVDTGGLPQDLHPVIQQIYARRGVLHADDIKRSAKELLHYEALKGVDGAVQILSKAMQQQKNIMVIGDFDADGATSTAVMMRALSLLGNRTHQYLVPNRFEYGYGSVSYTHLRAHETV